MCKLKSYNFWVRLASAVILIARIILAKFGYELDSALVIDVATLIAGLLVVLGIINEPTGITISYDESRKENDSITCENKGDNYMTEKIKVDLSECIARLSDEIKTNSGSDISNVVQIITGMLDLISNEVEERKSDEEKNPIDEMKVDKDVEVQFEHSENDDEGLVKDEGNVLLQNEVVEDEDINLTIDDILPEAVVIGTREDGQLCVAEYVENTDFQGAMTDITISKDEGFIQEKTNSEKFEQLVINAENIAPEITTETALSILQNNPDGLNQLREYFLKSVKVEDNAV